MRKKMAFVAAALLWVAARPAEAQQRVVCESNNKMRQYCEVETRGGVKLLRQFSGSPCTQGSTWGFDQRGIWVDRGCRAEFEIVGRRGGRPGWEPSRPDYDEDWGRTEVVYCASDDMRRQYCRTPFRNADVRLLNQVSRARCSEGQTWGVDSRGVWVDQGCRAEFEVRERRSSNGWPGGGNEQRFQCDSGDMKFHRCLLPQNVREVRLSRQRSEAPCIEGQSWGWDRNSVWVDRGCRAEFFVRMR